MKPCQYVRLFLLLCAALLSTNIAAQNYPEKTVRVIVAFPPSGSNDIVARIVFQKLTAALGQQFIIDNRGGAAGVIGATAVARSAPDGYTLMIHSSTLIVNALLKKPPYDTLNDFIGVMPLAEQGFMLVAHPSMPVHSMKEFISLARQRPGQIFYGTGGNGTPLHLAMALLESMTQIKLVQVQYSGGAPAVTAAMAGETQAVAGNIGVVAPHIKSGRLRALGVTSSRSTAQFPDIPPIGATVPGYEFTTWTGLLVPRGTPPDIIEKLNAEIKKILADPAVLRSLAAQDMSPLYKTSEQFTQFLKSDYSLYGKLAKEIAAKGGEAIVQ